MTNLSGSRKSGRSSSNSDPKEASYDKRTINMLSNMSARERNKFVRDNSTKRSSDNSGANEYKGVGGMKGVARGAKSVAKVARKAGDKDTAKTARKLGRQTDRTVARRKARRAAK